MDPGSDQSPLPAKDFCNSWGKGNPILGKGPLGNSYNNKMFYTGGNREKMVDKLQRMLSDLGYDIGSSGPDGKFGDETELAVKRFQEEHEDWDGNSLKVEGLVGPETSDALNRKMVGRWYDEYTTPQELTGDFILKTITSEKLKQARKILVDGKDVRKCKIQIIGGISPNSLIKAKLIIQLLDVTVIPFQPLGKTHYRLELDDPSFSPVDQQTDDQGVLSVEIPKSAKTGRLILDQLTYDLSISEIGLPDTLSGAVIRLGNLGYSDLPVHISPESADNKLLECPNEESNPQGIKQFQFDNNLEPSGELNEDTLIKLVKIYGC